MTALADLERAIVAEATNNVRATSMPGLLGGSYVDFVGILRLPGWRVGRIAQGKLSVESGLLSFRGLDWEEPLAVELHQRER